MWNAPSKTRLAKMPRLYETEKMDLKDKNVHLHFFVGGCDWYAVEFDGEDLFFGYTILNNDFQCAEWGYFSLCELSDVTVQGWCEIDCEKEVSFSVQKAVNIKKIREGMGWAESASEASDVPQKEVVMKTSPIQGVSVDDFNEFSSLQ